MQNLPIPAPATSLPRNATAPITPDAAAGGAPDSQDFSAVLARELAGKAPAHEANDAAVPVAATTESQLLQPGAGTGPQQMPPNPGLVTPALLAFMLGPGDLSAERFPGDQPQVPGNALSVISGRLAERFPGDQPQVPGTALPVGNGRPAERFVDDQPQVPGNAVSVISGQLAERFPGDQPQVPGTALPVGNGRPAERFVDDQPQVPGSALSVISGRLAERFPGDQPQVPGTALPVGTLLTELSAPRNLLQTNLPESPAWEPVGTAGSAAPGKFLPAPAAADKTYHSGTGDAMASRLPDTAPLPQLNNPALAAAASPAFAAASAAYNEKLDIRIGAPAWDGEFAQKVVWLATQQQQIAELHLNPPHLGPVEVMLAIGNDQGAQASAQFTSPHLAVREAIEAALPRLREMMADSGITLGNVTVSADSFQQQAEAGREERSATRQGAEIAQTATTRAPRPVATLIRGGRIALVDTFA